MTTGFGRVQRWGGPPEEIQPGDVVWLVLRRTLGSCAIGLAAGVLGATALRTVIASQLYGMSPDDPVVFASVAAAMTVTALLAAGAFDLSLWVFGAIFALVSFLVSIKATTERMTQSWIDRGKRRRLAAANSAMVSVAANG